MGYIETVLGYGSNHLIFSLNLLFSKIVRCKDGVALSLDTVDEIEIYKALESGEELDVTLQHDLFREENPDYRVFRIVDEDDFNELRDAHYISKDHGCNFGRGCCFIGIIIANSDDNSPDQDSIEKKITKAQKWLSELQQQNRISEDIKLILKENCCS